MATEILSFKFRAKTFELAINSFNSISLLSFLRYVLTSSNLVSLNEYSSKFICLS